MLDMLAADRMHLCVLSTLMLVGCSVANVGSNALPSAVNVDSNALSLAANVDCNALSSAANVDSNSLSSLLCLSFLAFIHSVPSEQLQQLEIQLAALEDLAAAKRGYDARGRNPARRGIGAGGGDDDSELEIDDLDFASEATEKVRFSVLFGLRCICRSLLR